MERRKWQRGTIANALTCTCAEAADGQGVVPTRCAVLTCCAGGAVVAAACGHPCLPQMVAQQDAGGQRWAGSAALGAGHAAAGAGATPAAAAAADTNIAAAMQQQQCFFCSTASHGVSAVERDAISIRSACPPRTRGTVAAAPQHPTPVLHCTEQLPMHSVCSSYSCSSSPSTSATVAGFSTSAGDARCRCIASGSSASSTMA